MRPVFRPGSKSPQLTTDVCAACRLERSVCEGSGTSPGASLVATGYNLGEDGKKKKKYLGKKLFRASVCWTGTWYTYEWGMQTFFLEEITKRVYLVKGERGSS